MPPPTTDVFRPRLPLDPFAALDPGPWHPAIHPNADPPSALLLLGEPSPSDLGSLLLSPSLASSLLVILSHAPPSVHDPPTPAVRILRLAAPLASQDSGALRLVSLLERADRVVRRFRASSAERRRRLVQFVENSVTGEFDVEEPYSPSPPSSPVRLQPNDDRDIPARYPSPAPSASSSLSSCSSTFSATSTATSTLSLPGSHRRRRRRRRHSLLGSSQPPADRAFDAVINYLPSALPDKVLLKHAILVSTLTVSFLAAPPAPLLPPPDSSSKSTRRLSVFSTLSFSDAHITDADTEDSSMAKKSNPRRFSSLLRRQHSKVVHSAPCSRDSLPLDPSQHQSQPKGKIRSTQQAPLQRNTHLIHILPPHVYPTSPGASCSYGRSRKQPQKPKPKLVQSIEQFLLAFGYPLQSMSLLPSPSDSTPASRRMSTASSVSAYMASGSISGDPLAQKPIPFLLPAGVFGSVPSAGKMSIGEVLVMGGLDRRDENGEQLAGIEGRVWIAGADDVVWEDPSTSNISNVADLAYGEPASTRHLAPPTAWRSASSTLPSKAAAQHVSSPTSNSRSPSSSPSRLSAPIPQHVSIMDKRLGKGKGKEKVDVELPTPPESTSSLEDESDATPSASVSASPSMEGAKLPSSNTSASDHDVGPSDPAAKSGVPNDKRLKQLRWIPINAFRATTVRIKGLGRLVSG